MKKTTLTKLIFCVLVSVMVSSCAKKDVAPSNAKEAVEQGEVKNEDASKGSDVKPADDAAKPTEAKPTEAKPTEAKPTEATPLDTKPAEDAKNPVAENVA